MRDPRVTEVVAIDPGFTHAFTPESIAKMTLPVHLLNLGATGTRWQAVGVGPEGSNLVAHLPDADFAAFAPASHFTLLADCKLLAPLLIWVEGEDPICSDPRGTNRNKIHACILGDNGKVLGLTAPPSDVRG